MIDVLAWVGFTAPLIISALWLLWALWSTVIDAVMGDERAQILLVGLAVLTLGGAFTISGVYLFGGQ